MKDKETKNKELRAFIAMCFDTKLDHIYHKVVKPVLASFNIICCRADEIADIGGIVDQIIDEIKNSDIILCDLTYQNPNVFYELGIAHILNKPTLMISQQGANFPFDVEHMRIIQYEDTNIGLLDLRDHLVNTLSNILHKGKDATYAPQDVFRVTANDLHAQRHALFSNSIDTVRYAIRFLGDCKDQESFVTIARLAETRNNSDIERDAYTAIHKIDPEKSLDMLIKYGLRDQKDFLVRERVVSLLADYDPNPEIIKQLIDQSKDTSWGVRRAICMAFAKCAKEETIPALEDLLGDSEIQVQLAAAEALSKIHSRKAKSA
jgi:hypothetical protein